MLRRHFPYIERIESIPTLLKNLDLNKAAEEDDICYRLIRYLLEELEELEELEDACKHG